MNSKDSPEFDPFNLPAMGFQLPFAAPLPRWPFSPAPTVRNWYRTTVNPLVWKLVPDCVVPMSQADGAFADRLVEQGIDVDLFPVRPLDDLDLRDLQHAIRKRGPIVLAAPRFWQEIFILVSSGRLADRESAMKILEVAVRGLRTPKGVDPETRKIAVTNLALGKRTKVGGSSSREALASNLGDYEHIWQLRAGGKKLRALLGMKASERRTTEATARRCFRTMTDYMRLLGQSQALSWAASELFPDAKTPEQVALQSICEARAWLRS